MADFQTRLLDPVKSVPYDPTDYKSVRQRLFDNTKAAFSQRFPVENERFALDVDTLEYGGKEPTLKDEKNAILKNTSVTRKLRGRFKLTNKETGAVKYSNPRVMMNVPHMTRRGTFIRNGSEQAINYMFRLSPGVYARKKDNGMFEAHVNPKQGTGGQFKIEMDPKSGIFRLRKGTRGYKLYPLLKRAGVTDDQIKKTWGPDILGANRQSSDVPNPQRKYTGGVMKEAADASASYDELLEAITKSELDPVSTAITLGKAHKMVTPETLLEASNKVLKVSKGEAEQDYRDSLEFQKIDGPADYFGERIIRDGGGIANSLLWRVSKKGDFADIPTAFMNKHVDAIFNEARHATYVDGSSPFSGIDQSTKITRIGEGGISGVRTAPSETRSVQDTFAGFIDPIRSSESLLVGLDMYLSNGVRKGDDGRLYTQLRNAKTGKEEWVDSLTVARSIVATNRELTSDKKFIPAIRGSKGVGVVPKGDVDYFIMDDTKMFSLGANSVPGKNGIMSNRLLMGGKYSTQALPLADREAPLVRSRQGDMTNEEAVGKLLGTSQALEGGRIASVDADKIVVRGLKGSQEYELYDNHPFNQKGYLRSIPQVKVGDEVKPGAILASTNYTDPKGVAAQGRNLRVAFMPWKGMNFEDAIAISATAAKKLAAEKMYKSRMPVSDNTEFDKKAFMGKFSSKFTKDQMDTIGDKGVVKKGTVLRQGDPMIVAVRHNDPKPGSMGRKTKTALMETWDHKYEGRVVDVDIGDKHASVYTRANVPMATGDKMCYSEDTEILTNCGWYPVKDILPGVMKAASLNPDTGEIEYVDIVTNHRYDHIGRMHLVETTQVSLCTTSEHRQYAAPRKQKSYKTVYDFGLHKSVDLFGKRYRLCKTGKWGGVRKEAFKLPDVTNKCGQGGVSLKTVPGPEVPMRTFLTVLGLYLSDGNIVWQEKTGDYGFDICAVKGDNPQIVRDTLDELGLRWSTTGDKVRVYSKHWGTYLRQFGKAHEKFIPEIVFKLPPEQAEVFYEWFMFGDGHRTQPGHGITTVSKQLAGDWQRLCLHLGMSAGYKSIPAHDTEIMGKKCHARECYKVSTYRVKNNPTINHGYNKTQSGQEESWVDYDGMVYCPELERNHIVYTRRNGKTVWSGNSNRYAAKGVVNVLPDNQMPIDKDGNPLDLVANPLGFISRGNPAQAVEVMAGKLARHTGVPEVLDAFSPDDMFEVYEKKLKEAGLSPNEDLYDPATGRKIPKVMTGESFFYRLMHMAEDKGGARGTGKSTNEETPLRGGSAGAKQMGGLHTSALVSHGAMQVIKDAKLVRGQCFTDDTEVLTERGWVNWGSVLVSDRLYTRSKEDATKAWYAAPERLVTNPFDGELFGYEGRHVDYLVTPNHKFWGVRGSVSRSKPWRKHQTLEASTVFSKECALDAYGAVYQGALAEDHVVGIPGTAKRPGIEIDIVEYCRLLGWWLSEGSTSVDDEGRGRVRISQLKEVNSAHFDEIESLLRRIGFENPYHEKHYGESPLTPNKQVSKNIVHGTVTGLRVNSAPLARHLKQYGDRSWNKRIPEIIFKAPVHARREFLRCYVAGDGCVRKDKRYGSTNWYISTSSKQMLTGLQRVALLNGMSAHLGVCGNPNNTYKRPHYRMVCGYNLTEVSVVKQPSAKYKGHYKQWHEGMVYCATMPTGMLYVRRGDKAMWSENSNDDFWRDFRMGRTPQMPGKSLVNEKFYEHLKGAGINVDENSDRINFFGMTNEQARKMTKGHELTMGRTFDQKTMRPIEGGMFDPKLFGPDGKDWAYIQMDEPMPNPVMEKSLSSILNLTQKDFNEVMAGEKEIGGATGGIGVKKALQNLDMKSEVKSALEALKTATPSKKDKALKRYRFLKSIEEQDLQPVDFMMDRIPVLPPKFRPVTQIAGSNVSADANIMYRAALFARDDLRSAKEKLPDNMITSARKNMYGTYKALTGMYDPDDAKLEEKNVQGLLKWVVGKGSSKRGAYQRRILGTSMNIAGRGVVTPNPSLPLDKIGIPIKQAWDVYEPFVVRAMVQNGFKPTQAVRMVKDREDKAFKHLQAVVKERPVIVNRAPSLHKYSVMAFEPQLVKGDTVQVSPSIVAPYGMDFDGDLRLESHVFLLISAEMCCSIYPTLTQKELDMLEKLQAVTVAGDPVEGYVMCVHHEDIPHAEEPTKTTHDNARFYEVPAGVYALAYDEDDGQLTVAQISYYSEHGINKPLKAVIVNLESGRQLFTDDDPRAVYGYDPATCMFGRWTPKDSVGKYVPRAIQLPNTAEVFYEVNTPASEKKTNRGYTLPTKVRLTKEFGYVLGALVGDGWVDSGVAICFSVTEAAIEERFKECFEKTLFKPNIWSRRVSKKDDEGSYGESEAIVAASKDAALFLEPMIGHGARNKHLPRFWFGTPVAFRMGLLEGLIDTDGSISVNRSSKRLTPQLMCSYHTTSIKLAAEVQLLLRSLGQDSRVCPYKTPLGKQAFNVTVSTKKIKSLGLELASVTNTRALEETKVAPETSRGGRHYVVPLSSDMCKELRKTLDHKDKEQRKLYNALGDMLKHKRTCITVQKARAILEHARATAVDSMTADMYAWAKIVDASEDIVWDRVDSFECTDAEEVGYDLCVPGFETFMNADGVILSNTVTYYVPVSKAAVKEAREKMLPSKNLLNPRDMKAHYTSGQEFVQGIYLATRPGKGKPKKSFQTVADAQKAYNDGKIDIDTPIVIVEKK